MKISYLRLDKNYLGFWFIQTTFPFPERFFFFFFGDPLDLHPFFSSAR